MSKGQNGYPYNEQGSDWLPVKCARVRLATCTMNVLPLKPVLSPMASIHFLSVMKYLIPTNTPFPVADVLPLIPPWRGNIESHISKVQGTIFVVVVVVSESV